jgi:hypothetical protein
MVQDGTLRTYTYDEVVEETVEGAHTSYISVDGQD